MIQKYVDLVVLDMAGTTVRDRSEVEDCFYQAAVESGLSASKQRIKDLQGYPKLVVVQTLWGEAIGETHPAFAEKVAHTHGLFCSILEEHYRTAEVLPVEGAVETISWLRAQGVKVALTTGFYRKVTDIILSRLGWDKGLDAQWRGMAGESVIDLSLTPDETEKGRPHPDMIRAAMRILGVEYPSRVVNAGDTPADLQSGYLASVGLNIGVTGGTHTEEALEVHPHDLLLHSVKDLPDALENWVAYKEKLKLND